MSPLPEQARPLAGSDEELVREYLRSRGRDPDHVLVDRAMTAEMARLLRAGEQPLRVTREVTVG